MYHQDNRGSIAPLDPDDIDDEMAQSEDWFSDHMSRVSAPFSPVVEVPQLEGTSPGTIVVYLGTIISLLLASSFDMVREMFKKLFLWVFEALLPKTLAQKQNSSIQREHLSRLKKKWNRVEALPTYSAQEESMTMLQEIQHDASKEQDNALHPQDAPVKTIVKLLLDQRNRPHVQFMLEGTPVSFLVDTGASLSVLSYSSYLAIPHHESLVRSYVVPKLYDHQQHEIKIMFSVVVKATVHDKTLLFSLLVSSASRSNVLGMDILLGRSLVLTHRGTDAYLIVGECTAEKRPVMKLPDKMPLYVLEDLVVPAESQRTVTVTPCVYPMYVDIPDSYLEIEYVSPAEGFEGRTKHFKLNEEGKAKLKVCNRSLVDLFLHANSVIGTGTILPDFVPLPAKKVKGRQTKSEIVVKNKEILDLEPKPASIQELTNETKADENSKTIQPPKQEDPKVDPHGMRKVDCFCSLPNSVIIIKGNRYGDTNCPFICAGSYIRDVLTSGAPEKFRLGKKQIVVIYSTTKKDFLAALQNSSEGTDAIYIANKDENQDTCGIEKVELTGKCEDHPFFYNAKPSFISFCRTQHGKHLKMIHDLPERIVFEVLNMKVEMYYSNENSKQIHFVLHIPDVLVLKSHWLHNIVAALVKPFSTTVRILEPYLFPDQNSYRSTMFNGILQKVATLHGITIQGRMPHMEKTFDANPGNIKNCTCDYCIKCRDKLTYGNMNGSLDQTGEGQQNFLQ